MMSGDSVSRLESRRMGAEPIIIANIITLTFLRYIFLSTAIPLFELKMFFGQQV